MAVPAAMMSTVSGRSRRARHITYESSHEDMRSALDPTPLSAQSSIARLLRLFDEGRLILAFILGGMCGVKVMISKVFVCGKVSGLA